ncbi:MAG: 5'-nucleotidase [Myxococcota bacterium]
MEPRLSRPLVIGVLADVVFDLGGAPPGAPSPALDPPSSGLFESDREGHGPGRGLPLVRSLLGLNQGEQTTVELVLLSRRDAASSLGVLSSVRSHGLDVLRAAFTGGEPLSSYLRAFQIDLVLTSSEEDVEDAATVGIAGGLVREAGVRRSAGELRVALDADALSLATEPVDPRDRDEVLASGSSFGALVGMLTRLRAAADEAGTPLRIALLTSRGSADQERVLLGLQRSGLQLDEAFSLGGLPREGVLDAFGPQILLGGGSLPADASEKPEFAPVLPVEPLAVADVERDEPSLHSPLSRLRFRRE